ncbi:anti-sigma regulatory factor (Ser/Thr protein kinase) [Desulfomicrobium macestii]|uniref:Anti-sigma regulatory factor (Ser/Thr protein kinase) n=1 Tax=Desulfomicrobium macestii TaxID=90731 RepID=A0ABR9H0F6_9BACT|nr:ATP-binding protein [Desulfomicrobium macestii]MBE1424180.1 anti-sigma regulatory factor (Ser/Thr protein kinase) [Desulfomicrobium macestii]
MAALTVPARIEELNSVNEFLESRIPPDFQGIASHVRLAAEELLVNVFTHAYDGGPGEARVECRPARLDGQDYLFFSVTDWGHPFDPFDEAPRPDLDLDADHRPIGGLGVHLVKSVSARHEYRHHNGANIVELYFAKPE